MDGHLRKLRQSKQMTLEELQFALDKHGKSLTVSHLSFVERSLAWPSRDVVDSLVELFNGELTEMQILYPFRDSIKESKNV